MKFTSRLRIKFNSLKEFYLFQKLGWPKIKNEKISKSVLKKYLPAKPIVIDCGAHDGADSVELAKILHADVHAFEPVDELYQRLLARTADTPVHCYKLALSNKEGEEDFYISEGASDASSSLLPPKDHCTDHPDTFFNKIIKVQTVTLDEWALSYKINRVDLLWLDMQGAELAMLKASSRILNTVSVIHTEVSTKETYTGVPLYKEYKSFLESMGFKAVIEAVPHGWDMGNVLFVKSQHM